MSPVTLLLAYAVATTLMVFAGMQKKRLEWNRRDAKRRRPRRRR